MTSISPWKGQGEKQSVLQELNLLQGTGSRDLCHQPLHGQHHELSLFLFLLAPLISLWRRQLHGMSQSGAALPSVGVLGHLDVRFSAHLCKREFGEFVPPVTSSGPWILCGMGKVVSSPTLTFHPHPTPTPPSGIQAVPPPPRRALLLEMGGNRDQNGIFTVDTGR